MIKMVQNFKPTGYKNSLFAIFILLALAWLFFHSELSDPEIHEQANPHFDYCHLVATAIQSHQPVFHKVVSFPVPSFYFEKQFITSTIDESHSITKFPSISLPLILIIKQLLI
ncbi:hypothetical protein JW964_07710 [candidate division KSB1 bacterium]|nr:hypothetical protein [candidate division KSB1 bacterium]